MSGGERVIRPVKFGLGARNGCRGQLLGSANVGDDVRESDREVINP